MDIQHWLLIITNITANITNLIAGKSHTEFVKLVHKM